MKKMTFLLVFLLLFGCKGKSLEKIIDPAYPNKAATHVVELYKVQIGADDFNLSTFGNPLDIKIYIKENGKIIDPVTYRAFKGTRGEREFNKPITWVVHFEPSKNYQIVLEEVSVIADAYSWQLPGTPKIGYWPIAHNNGLITFGKNSYLQFRDSVAK